MFCRKRTKKKTTKVGRKKKEKTTAAPAQQTTPRTRGALAREAAAKAKREAEEAELKAATVREAAEAAAREEIEATKNEFVAHVPAAREAAEPPVTPLALALVHAPKPIKATPPAKRLSPSSITSYSQLFNPSGYGSSE